MVVNRAFADQGSIDIYVPKIDGFAFFQNELGHVLTVCVSKILLLYTSQEKSSKKKEINRAAGLKKSVQSSKKHVIHLPVQPK